MNFEADIRAHVLLDLIFDRKDQCLVDDLNDKSIGELVLTYVEKIRRRVPARIQKVQYSLELLVNPYE
jgi:hypothetical protein